MSSRTNIEAALANVGSSACWTLPGEVSWEQSVTGKAPTAGESLADLQAAAAVSDDARTIMREMQQVSKIASAASSEVRDITTARSARKVTPANMPQFAGMVVSADMIDIAVQG